MGKLKKLIKTPNLYFRDYFLKKVPLSHSLDNRKINIVNEKKPKKELNIKNENLKEMNNKNTNSFKNPIDYLKELTDFSSHYDVNLLKYKNEYIWPYLRQHLWVQLYLLGLGKKENTINPYRLQLASHNHVRNYNRSLLKSKTKAFEIEELPEKKIDFLFLTVLNASEQVELDNNEIYFRITDPWFEKAKKVGVAEKIEILKTNTPAIEKCRKYKFKPTFILPPSIITSGYSYSINWNQDFFKMLGAIVKSININEELIKNTIDWELHTKNYYIDLLKKYSPKVLFLNGFHYHGPLISAASELGIKTVDIQHGIQVGWNPLYNDWNEMPIEGYKSIPDYFLVWGNKEKKSIEDVFRSNRHKAIIGGYPWLSHQLNYMNPIDDEKLSIMGKYKKKYLVILQNQKIIPEIYKELIDNSSDDELWIIRHHPKGNKFKKSDFSLKNKNILIGKYYDTVSLARLFQVVDVCFSDGSTVSIESDYYGVYNIIFSKEGKNNYINEINEGAFFFAENKLECQNILRSLDLREKKSRLNSFSDVDEEKVLINLLSNI